MPLRSFRQLRLRARIVIVLLALVAFATPCPVAAQSGAPLVGDPSAAEIAFDDAQSLVHSGLYGPALRALQAFRQTYPRDAHAPHALFLQAESALALGDDLRAADLYAEFEDTYPAHPLAAQARLALGRYYYASSRYEEAEAVFRDALAQPLDPIPAAEIAYLLGQTARKQDKPTAAVAAFERAATDDTPTAPAALYALGVVHTQQGDAQQAARAYARLDRRYPESAENADVGLALAEAYLRTGQRAEAAREIERRRSQLVDEDAVRAALLLGETRLQLGDADGAREVLLDVPADSPYRQRAALAYGRAAFAQEDWNEAIRALTEARATEGTGDDPVAHEAAYYRGLALKQIGQLGDAEAALRSARDRRPDGPFAQAALLELGILQYERRRYDDAVISFDRLLTEAPNGPLAGEAARRLGESYATLGQSERAREAFDRAEALGSATSETRTEVAFQAAYRLYQENQFEEATNALLRVAADDPTGARAGEALFYAGESAFQSDRYDRAEDILDEFARRFPDHPKADAGRYVLAWTHFKRRDYTAAAAGFERFLSAYTRSSESVPYYADALLRLGDSYSALRQFDDARAVYALVPDATSDGRGSDYALFQTAQAFAGQGRATDALAAYGRLIDGFPQSGLLGAALVARGEILFAQGDYDAARADYDRVARTLADDPAAPRALVGTGDSYANQERFEEAEVAYRAVLTRYPNSPYAADALDGLGFVYQSQGRDDELDALIATFENRVTDPEALARIRLGRAEAALAAGDITTSTQRLEALLSTEIPADIEAEALLLLARNYVDLGAPNDAAQVLRRLGRRFPASPLAPEARLQLAEALLAAGDPAGALGAAQDFADAYPNDAEQIARAIKLEADALRAQDLADEADARLRDLLREHPGSAAAAAVLRERPDLVPETPPSGGGGIDGAGDGTP
ncbi:MAG: tetratricopeptide repeat protein [Rubricoccaceae bacterium]